MAVDKFLTEDGLNYFYNTKVLPYLNSNMILGKDSRAYEYAPLGEERIVGHWLDGKPLYMMTQDCISVWNGGWQPLSNCGFPEELENIAEYRVQNERSTGRHWDGVNQYTVGDIFVTNNNDSLYFDLKAAGYSGAQNQVFFNYGNMSSGSRTHVYLTIFYTKTTDAAGSYHYQDPYYISRPDLWPVGQEIDFGDGLYGIRVTGKDWLNEVQSHSVTLGGQPYGQSKDLTAEFGLGNVTKIVSMGGSVKSGNGNCKEIQPFGFQNGVIAGAGNNNHMDAYISGAGTPWHLMLGSGMAGDGWRSGDSPYDVWITYRKDSW